MVQMWFWFVAGVAYVIIGIFTSLSARRLHFIDIQTLASYQADDFSYEEIDRMKREWRSLMIEKQQLANERKISSEDWKYWLEAESKVYELEANKRAAENFNKAAKLNRDVLYIAAGSFFIAAIISFAQSLSLI